MDESDGEKIARLDRALKAQVAFTEYYKARLYQRDEQVGQLYAALDRALDVITDAMRYHNEEATRKLRQ